MSPTGALPRIVPGSVTSNVPVTVHGEIFGNLPGTVNGTVQGSVPGTVPGTVQGSEPGTVPCTTGDEVQHQQERCPIVNNEWDSNLFRHQFRKAGISKMPVIDS